MMGFYEEIEIGDERELGRHVFTREAIVEFARQFDPQRFHIDEAAAKESLFGGLCASGWHVAAASMRAVVDYRARVFAERAARGEALPPLGVSPGITNLRWPVPTRPGDEVVFRSRVIEKRETRRPEWGIVGVRVWGTNQRGEDAITLENRPFVARRGP
jgi:acyl dehydratase